MLLFFSPDVDAYVCVAAANLVAAFDLLLFIDDDEKRTTVLLMNAQQHVTAAWVQSNTVAAFMMCFQVIMDSAK